MFDTLSGGKGASGWALLVVGPVNTEKQQQTVRMETYILDERLKSFLIRDNGFIGPELGPSVRLGRELEWERPRVVPFQCKSMRGRMWSSLPFPW
jgi:hypothetical protein